MRSARGESTGPNGGAGGHFVTGALALALLGAPIAAGAEAVGRQAAAGDSPPDLSEARAHLEATASAGRMSGVILIGRGDEIVLHEAYGFADVELGVAMRTDHVLRIGSLTKPITASAVIVAVDRGLLSLDDRLCDRLDPCPESWRPVTLRHLLSHTSGVPDYFGALEAVPVEETAMEVRRVLGGLPADSPLESPPGAEYAYSNFNYVLAGVVLEQATGMYWEDALRALVLEPLDLSTIRYDDVHAIVANRARGYARNEQLGLRNIDYDDHAAYAAGGLLASARDLFGWSRGVLTAELFEAALLEESLSPRLGDYGLGWQVRRFFGRRIYNHTGGIDGFSSHIAHYPDEQITIVVLHNVEDDAAILTACDLAGLLFGRFDRSMLESRSLTPRQRCGLEAL